MRTVPAATRHDARPGLELRELARAFDRARRSGVIVHHDDEHRWLAIAPSGVHVVDTSVRADLVERRFDAVGRRSGLRLFVDGRDRTKLVEPVLAHADDLRARLARRGFGGTPIFPCLCVPGATWNRRPRTFEVGGVSVTWPSELVELVTLPGPISPDTAGAVDAALVR